MVEEKNEEVEAEKKGKSRAVRDQTHLRENKREEVKLYHVINSREEKRGEKKTLRKQEMKGGK